MPKMKTHKGLKKRVRLTGGGKLRYKKSNKGHLLSGKSGNRLRRLRKPGLLPASLTNKIRRAIQE